MIIRCQRLAGKPLFKIQKQIAYRFEWNLSNNWQLLHSPTRNHTHQPAIILTNPQSYSPTHNLKARSSINSKRGSGDSSVVRARDSWSKSRGFESRQERREHFLLQGQLSVPPLISVCVPSPCYRSSTYKFPVILPKVQAAGYSYVCGLKWSDTVTRRIVVRMERIPNRYRNKRQHRTCTETAAVLRGTSRVTTK